MLRAQNWHDDCIGREATHTRLKKLCSRKGEDQMEKSQGSAEKRLGQAQRIRVRMPLSATRMAWDCRPFGFGRIVTPRVRATIEIADGVHLNLMTGELRADVQSARR